MARPPFQRPAPTLDPEAWAEELTAELLAGIRRRIWWVARNRGVHLQDDALDDLVQDLLLLLWQRGVTSAVGDFRAHVLCCAGNLTLDFLRRRRAKKREEPDHTNGDGALLLPAWAPTPEQQAIARDELRHQLARCRRLLSARHYRVFVLAYVAGLSRREVGAVVGLRPSSVDSVLHRLRCSLGEKDVVSRPRASHREQAEQDA
jgi:RNA polymerase sigma factor (sigma-70 family)